MLRDEDLLAGGGRWIAALSAKAPVVLLVDDLDVAGAGMLHVIWQLAMLSSPKRVLVVASATAADSQTAPMLARTLTMLEERGALRRMTLPPLDELEVAELLERIPVAPHAHGADCLHELAGGSPFLIAETLSLRTPGGVDERAASLSRICHVARRRMAELGRATAALLEQAALFETDFTVDELAAASGATVGTVSMLVDDAVSAARPATELAAFVLLRAPAVSRSARRRSLRDQAARRDVRVVRAIRASPSTGTGPTPVECRHHGILAAVARLILHITTAPEWAAAQAAGEYRAPSLDTEGFIHCSTPAQVVHVGDWFYREVPDLVLLCIDPGALDERGACGRRRPTRSRASSRTCTARSPSKPSRTVVPWERGEDGFDIPDRSPRPRRAVARSSYLRGRGGPSRGWLLRGRRRSRTACRSRSCRRATRGRARSTRCPPGRPSRFTGVRRTISSWISWLSSTISSALVATEPTAIALTRTFGARSAAISRVMCVSAAFAVPYATKPRSRSRPIADEMLTTAPEPAASMCGAAALVSTNAVVHVEVERALEVAGARVHERARHRAARVVDDHVDAAELGHRLRDDVFDRLVVVHVARDRRARAGRSRALPRRPRRAAPWCGPRARRRRRPRRRSSRSARRCRARRR